MRELTLLLRAETGAVTQGSATIEHFSTPLRWVRGTIFLVGGFGLGAALIVVPILHLITTWALPLAGAIACVGALRTRARLENIQGCCPGCEASFSHNGGRAVFPIRIDCPDCRRPISIEPAGETDGQG